jgi:long-chain fatty acid transport protein
MFWNPATVTQAGSGLTTESHAALILGNVEIHAQPGSTLLAQGAESGNISQGALLPTSYAAYRLSPSVVIGASMNAPFGLVTKADNIIWAGHTQARTSSIKTYNVNLVAGIQLGNGFSVGIGPQVQLIKGRLTNSANAAGTAVGILEADDIAVGATAGLHWQAGPGTMIGLGYRSRLSHKLEGDLTVTRVPGQASVEADVALPDIVTLSIRQAVSQKLTMTGTVEWSNWSELERLRVVCQAAGGACPAAGVAVQNSSLAWKDGWMVALGGEYAYNPALTLRAGLAYEKSPIRSASERTLRVPDTDRVWASVGASYALSPKMTLDLAYSHIFGKDGAIDRTEGGVRVVGESEARVDIISAAIKTKW